MGAELAPVRSAVSGVAWPGIPARAGATLLGMLDQLDQTQWWTGEQLERQQLLQLGLSLRNAHEQIPFHHHRLAAAGYRPEQELTPERLRALPRMTRQDVHAQGEALLAQRPPAGHGRLTSGETSGSTGVPIRYYGTELTQLFWRSFTLRDHVWRGRDLSGKLAAIRPRLEDGEQPGWGPATDLPFRTGPCVMMSIRRDLDVQLAWLERQKPMYILTQADNLDGLARLSLEKGVRMHGLREARSYGTVLPSGIRERVQAAWRVPLSDIYTAEEVGYIAIQCPQHEHYHIQSENLLVEILGDSGEPCLPGEIGRVVISTLHNFVMPLVRYEIGDYAEAGAPCSCGRGLPVIRRVLGRSRNVLILPDGRRRWPSFPSEKWSHIAPVRQLQLAQTSHSRIDVRVVLERALTEAETARLVAALQDSLGYPFEMEVRQVAEIPRSASYKFEDFTSEIA